MAFTSNSAAARQIAAYSSTATAAASTSQVFTIPQDAQSIICKFYTASNFTPQGTNAVQLTIQTSEDGGTTWRDAAAWTTQSVVLNQNAHFCTIPVAGATGRGVANWIGSVAASTLALAATASVATGVASGLPMMGTLGRIYQTITGTLTTGGVNCDIYAPSTDFTA